MTDIISPIPPPTINGKRVVAFLQNPWFKPGTSFHTIDLYRTSLEYRRRVLAMSKTGKWLIKAFGQKVYDNIHWDNASPVHGQTYSHESPADTDHMRTVINMIKPHIIICFGRQAMTGMKLIDTGGVAVLYAHHPMARGNKIENTKLTARLLQDCIERP